MKMHLAAICFNERELEAYVNELKSQGFESVSDTRKADDGTYYQAMAKATKAPLLHQQPVAEAASIVVG